jgi:hypothetical protein
MSEEIYAALCAPFEEGETFTLKKGGAELTYITGEAVTSRLNRVLGVDGWEFQVTAQGHDERHAWVQGQLTAHFPDRGVVRGQFGECQTNAGLSLGDARKGAATDALKKCASLIGVGLYLSHKAEVEQATQAAAPVVRERPTAVPRSYSQVWQDAPAEEESEIGCTDCGALIQPWQPKDGSPAWSAQRVADRAKSKFGRVLCWGCGKRATG